VIVTKGRLPKRKTRRGIRTRKSAERDNDCLVGEKHDCTEIWHEAGLGLDQGSQGYGDAERMPGLPTSFLSRLTKIGCSVPYECRQCRK
jgi:hypothetical protein